MVTNLNLRFPVFWKTIMKNDYKNKKYETVLKYTVVVHVTASM